MGEVAVPSEAYYGASTARALENFPVSDLRFPAVFIEALCLIKSCSARVNQELGLLESNLADAIVAACDRIAAGEFHDPEEGAALLEKAAAWFAAQGRADEAAAVRASLPAPRK